MTTSNIMSLFSGASSKPAPAQVPPTGQNQFANVDTNIVNGADAAGRGQTPPANPLDSLKEMFKLDPKAAPQNPWDNLNSPVINADWDKFNTDLASKALVNLDPEKLQKLQSGDLSVFPDIINAAVQQAVMHSARLSHGFVDSGFKTYSDRLAPALQAGMRDYQTTQTLETTLPFANHEAVKPMIASMQSFLLAKNPNMSPAEVSKQISAFFGAVAQQPGIAPEATQQRDPITGQPMNQQTNAGNVDWASYFK